MNIEEIEKIVEKNVTDPAYFKISFKKRNDVYGIFVRDQDYSHLKSKNFWRIVTSLNFAAFQQTKDLSLAKIFHGSAFSRLSVATPLL